MPKGASHGGRKRGKRRRYIPQTARPSGQAPPVKSAIAAPSIRTPAPVRQPVQQAVPQQPHLAGDLKMIGVITGLMVILLVVLHFVL